VSFGSGTYSLGPEDATLSVRTARAGAAAKAGHDLLIHVTSWQGTLALGEDAAQTSVELTADAGSLRVIEGTGGVQALGDEDKANIERTIDGEVLHGREIEFRSTRAEPTSGGDRIDVEGELTIDGRTEPISFELALGEDGALSASAVVKQTDWGIEPYSALFGALKVRDEVEVAIEGHLQPEAQSR
jgi:polyisoprenoid-binding protein YceI